MPNSSLAPSVEVTIEGVALECQMQQDIDRQGGIERPGHIRGHRGTGSIFYAAAATCNGRRIGDADRGGSWCERSSECACVVADRSGYWIVEGIQQSESRAGNCRRVHVLTEHRAYGCRRTDPGST